MNKLHRTQLDAAEPYPTGPLVSVAAWRAAKADPNYRQEAARQARSAAVADVEDRVMEWIAGVSAEAWDDL